MLLAFLAILFISASVNAQIASSLGAEDMRRLVASAERNVGQNRAATCRNPITMSEARAYVARNRSAFTRQRDQADAALRALGLNARDQFIMTKTMVMPSTLDFKKERDEQVYLESLARGYKKQIDDECEMCAEEKKLKPYRQQLSAKLGLRAPSCRVDINNLPELVFLYESHDEQERRNLPTAKRGAMAHANQANSSFTFMTETLDQNNEALAEARLLNYFQLPVARDRFGANGAPARSSNSIQGLDSSKLIAARTLQIALQSVESKYVQGSMNGSFETDANRAAFFEAVAKNPSMREYLKRLSMGANGGAIHKDGLGIVNRQGEVIHFDDGGPIQHRVFGVTRLPMDRELAKVWRDPNQKAFRAKLAAMAEGYLQNAGAAQYGANAITQKPFWNASFDEITKTASRENKTTEFDDATFYFMMRSLYYMSMNELPQARSAETVGGLYRDWAFTNAVEQQICNQQKQGSKKKIVINLGAAHATRVADLLKADGFATDSKLRFLNARALNQTSVVPAINSPVTHLRHLEAKVDGYKSICTGYQPKPQLNRVTPSLMQRLGDRVRRAF